MAEKATAGARIGELSQTGATVGDTTRPRVSIGLAFSAFVLIGANDGAVGVLLPSIIAYYRITKATASLLFPASTVGYLAAALSSGPLLERIGRRALLVAGAIFLGLGALLALIEPPFLLLLPAFALIGFGVGILDAGLNAYVAGLPRSAGLLNYLHAFYGAGALLGPLIAAAVLALATGQWNVTYLVWALAAALALAGFRLVFGRDGVQTRGLGSAEHAAKSGNSLAIAMRSRLVWLAALFLFVYVGTEVSLGSWSYTLLTESRHVPVAVASVMVSGYWLGLTAGRLALAHSAQRWGAARLIQVCLAGTLGAVLLVWVAPAGAVAALGLWVAGFSLGPMFPSTIALIDATVSPRLQQSAIGFAAGFGAMGGATFPWLAGNLIQRVGLTALLPFSAVLTLALLVLWLTFQRSVRHERTA
jgi:fucose permease